MRPLFLLGALALLPAITGCTGLTPGPEVSAATPVPVSRDSSWARVRRALTAESFSLDLVDSLGGHITGLRYPSATSKLGSAQSCRVKLALDVGGTADSAELKTISRWLAPQAMAESATKVCEQERADVLERVQLTVVPPPAP